MTLLVAWTGIDSRSPASVYIATDSRVSWGDQNHFDHSNKTFALRQFPAVLGYCGDSLSSQMLISQAIAVIEANPEHKGMRLEDLVNIFIHLIVRNYNQYPVTNSTGSFTVVICGKATLGSAGDFECYRIDSKFKKTTKTKLTLPSVSGPIVITGSGEEEFKNQYKKHQATQNPNKSTSRDVFHAFYQTIKQSENCTVGPIPQIVSVIRKPKTGGIYCGVVIEDKRYFSGLLIDRDIAPRGLQWFNANFEITNLHTKRRELDAQVQPTFRCK